ncbi:MAG: hypothetical protein ACE37K_04725 [Planctomycetota bacterium]
MNTTSFRPAHAGRHLTLLCLLAAPCAAQQALQPSSASTTLPGSSSILGLISQGGLTATYEDAVTDFATFVARASHQNSSALSLDRPFAVGGIVTFDLGTSREVDAIALWGQQTLANTLTAFTLFADGDDNFGNGTTATLGSFASPIGQAGEAFAFAPVATRFVHLRVDGNGGGTRVKIGEAVFRRAASVDDADRTMVAPTAVTTSLIPLFGLFPEGNLIDQSGLTAPYVDGVTDFATYVPSTNHPSNNATSLLANSNGQNQATGVVDLGETITLDFGQQRAVDAIAIWNSLPAQESLLGFELFVDDDSDFGNGTTATLGSFACAPVLTGQAFAFRPVRTRFVHLQMTAHGGGPFLRLGEIAFRNAVGVTATLAHTGSFVGGVAYDRVSDELVVVDDTDLTVTFYDRATGAQTAQFAAPGNNALIGAQVDITTGNLWVVGEDEVVRQFDRTGVIVSSFSVQPAVNDASALAIDPVSDTIWISNDGNNTVTEFDKSGNPTGASFTPAGSTDGDGLAYDPTTRTFLLGEDGQNAILVVDRTGALVDRFDLGSLGLSPEGLAVDTTTGKVFCGNGTVASTVSELSGIVAAPPAGALTRYGTPCGGRIAASDVVADDGATDAGVWFGYQGTLPPGNAFLLLFGTSRQNIPLAPIVPSTCTAFATGDLLSVFDLTSGAGRGGFRLALPPGFRGFRFTAWAADVDLGTFGIPSASGGLEIVLQ